MINFLREFFKFIIVRKKYVLIPVFLLLILLSAILVLSQGSAVAPFIYSIF